MSGRNELELLTKILHDTRGEVRSNAIFALGRRRDKRAADALVACALRHPTDVDEGLQIVGALATLAAGKTHTTALHYLVARHPNSVVKHAGSVLLESEAATCERRYMATAETGLDQPDRAWSAK